MADNSKIILICSVLSIFPCYYALRTVAKPYYYLIQIGFRIEYINAIRENILSWTGKKRVISPIGCKPSYSDVHHLPGIFRVLLHWILDCFNKLCIGTDFVNILSRASTAYHCKDIIGFVLWFFRYFMNYNGSLEMALRTHIQILDYLKNIKCMEYVRYYPLDYPQTSSSWYRRFSSALTENRADDFFTSWSSEYLIAISQKNMFQSCVVHLKESNKGKPLTSCSVAERAYSYSILFCHSLLLPQKPTFLLRVAQPVHPSRFSRCYMFASK